MNTFDYTTVEEAAKQLYINALCDLPPDVRQAIEKAYSQKNSRCCGNRDKNINMMPRFFLAPPALALFDRRRCWRWCASIASTLSVGTPLVSV